MPGLLPPQQQMQSQPIQPQPQQRRQMPVQNGKTLAKGVYPANEQEAQKFVVGIIKSLHSDQTRPKLMKQLTNKQVPIVMRIASAAAAVISAMISRVIMQTKESPISSSLPKLST